MDPNECLEKTREAARRYYEAMLGGDRAVMESAATELEESFSSLDQWLSHDGFFPDAWKSHNGHRVSH